MTNWRTELPLKLRLNALEADIYIRQIEKSPTLVNMLDQYAGEFDYNRELNGANYDRNINLITIGIDRLRVLTLAHELAHALGKYQAKDHNGDGKFDQNDHDSPHSFSAEHMDGEGDDHIFGSMAHDVLQGGAGGDEIQAGAGNDLLAGDSDVVINSRISNWSGNYRPLTYRHTYNWDKGEFDPVQRLGRFNSIVEASAQWALAIDHDQHSYHITRNYSD